MLGTLRAGGFSLEMTAHAYALLDAFVYGFAVQEASLPFEGPDGVAEVAEPIMELMSAGDTRTSSTWRRRTTSQPGYDFGNEFEFGLNLILDALATSIQGDRPPAS